MASVAKRAWTHQGEKRSAWVVRYKDAGGAHRSKQFDRKKEADAYRLKVEIEIEKGSHVAPAASAKVADIERQFMAVLEQRAREGRRMAPGTIHLIRQALRLHILPSFAQRVASEVTCNDIDAWLGALSAKGLGPRTVKNTAGVAKQLFDYAQRRSLVHTNVVRDVLGWTEHRHRTAPPVRTFSREDALALLTVVGGPTPRFQHERNWALGRLWVYLAAFCGMRLGEITGLAWGTVDLEAGQLRVVQSLCARTRVLKGTKSAAGVRTIPMPDIVLAELRTWKQRYARPGADALVFTSRDGTAIRHGNFYKGYWWEVLKAAGLNAPDSKGRTLHFHALRHFAASMMVYHGGALTDVARILGHSSFDVTLQVYAHPIANDRECRGLLEGVAVASLPSKAPSDVAHRLRTAR